MAAFLMENSRKVGKVDKNGQKQVGKVDDWIANGKEALLLTGARQIGKTYLIRQCLKDSNYSYIELNFIEQPELVELFSGAKDAKELLMRCSNP